MQPMDWIWLGLAVLLCVPIPFLVEAEKRSRARDAARWEEHKRAIRQHFAAEIASAKGSIEEDGK